MPNLVKVRLKESYKDGAPGVGNKIIYFGKEYIIDLDNPTEKHAYEFYKAKGAFQGPKRATKEKQVAKEVTVDNEIKEDPAEEVKEEAVIEDTVNKEPSNLPGKKSKKSKKKNK